MEPKLTARWDRKLCLFCNSCGIQWPGTRGVRISDISAWAGSVNPSVPMLSSFGGDMFLSRMMSDRITTCSADYVKPTFV